jgi:hypothetical protein
VGGASETLKFALTANFTLRRKTRSFQKIAAPGGSSLGRFAPNRLPTLFLLFRCSHHRAEQN